MRIELVAVSKGAALPTISTAYASGEATLVVAETEQRPTVLGLIASGRMRPHEGTVTIDGASDSAAIRRRVALVDAPTVAEPPTEVMVAGIVAEELLFAGRRGTSSAVADTIEALEVEEYARDGIGTVPAIVRLHILCELALLRDGVEGLVIVAPDRHGGDPWEWWRLAIEIAERGIAVLVIVGRLAAQVLTSPAAPTDTAAVADPAADVAEPTDAATASTSETPTTPDELSAELPVIDHLDEFGEEPDVEVSSHTASLRPVVPLDQRDDDPEKEVAE